MTSGGYERRQVRLKRLDTGNPASIWSAAFEGPGAVGGLCHTLNEMFAELGVEVHGPVDNLAKWNNAGKKAM